MNYPKLSNLYKVLGIVVLTVFLYVAYRLIVVPATLDFSYLGVLGLILACVLAIWVLPKGKRKQASLYVAAILMMLYAFQDITSSFWLYQILSFLVILVFFGIVLGRYASIRFLTTTITAVVAILAILIEPMDRLPFLSNFAVQYSSPNLVDSSTSNFAIYPESIQRGVNGAGDILTTFTNRPLAPITKDQIDPKHDTMFVSLPLNGKSTFPTILKSNQLTSSMFFDLGTSGFPYHTFWLTDAGGYVHQDYSLTAEPEQLAQSILNLGSYPLLQNQLEYQTIQTDQSEWASFQSANGSGDSTNPDLSANRIIVKNGFLTGTWNGKTVHIPTVDTRFLAVGHVVAGQGEQVLAEGNNHIDVYDLQSGKLLSTYQSTVDVPLPNSILTADVDNDGQDEILMNTVPAQIIKLTSDGTWKTLWVSGRTSFQFDCAGKLGNDSKLTIVANSPSELRNVDIRYITGYQYTNGSLERLWRISKPNFVMGQLVNEKGSNQQDLMLTDYGSQKITVLRKHDIPVQGILYGIFALYLILSLLYFKGLKRGQQHVES